MPILTIELPERLKAFVDEKVSEGKYASPSAMVQELLIEDLRHQWIAGNFQDSDQFMALLLGQPSKEVSNDEGTGTQASTSK